MEPQDITPNLFTLLLFGGAIILALIFGSKAAPAPQYADTAAPVYNYSYEDNSTNVCVGWCPDGSR
jgi:hypothetical protein